MNKRSKVRLVVIATSMSLPLAQAQVVSQPVGTPNVPGCAAPRSWKSQNGYYQCLMPPVNPGGTSPGGSDRVDAALSVCNPLLDRMQEYMYRSALDRQPTVTWAAVRGDYQIVANRIRYDPANGAFYPTFKTANGGNLGAVLRASDTYVISDAVSYGAVAVTRPGWFNNAAGGGAWMQYMWIASCLYTPERQQILLTWKNYRGIDADSWTPCPIYGNGRGDVCWDSARNPGSPLGPWNRW
ncbi:TPA: hypothetical protein ACT5CR_005480 [Burkholderia cenocepacia]|uniref:hypothetical protein n=1 Tax=Burkholderia cepacia complex TaxID=87882 RepID=UPI00210D0014|nr:MULTISPECIES: hypothetical protein [Burkholderia cepacia complex]MCQ4564180.1 hypothetical protein [Burkholderia contaminans]MCW3504542.1 hypothetical protein [Burkholderia cenocepacia]MCW3512004.1 hypothetical protein [Burkholderia cenocepacia]MCW3519663.1 hypothetical protein [Burkholderia cenocepacia]MCW3535021.1 hypothetical protein [Burkholderia cenocepacia]